MNIASRNLRQPLSAMLLACAALWPAAAYGAGDAVPLAPHRAVYDMMLDTRRASTSVTDLSGRMVYELTGSACEGYTQTMRFVTHMIGQDGKSSITDLRSTSWEEGTGNRLRFESSQLRDETRAEATQGEAARAAPGGEVRVELREPAKKTLAIPARTYFPVQHSIALIAAARAGKTSFRADLYDGSETGEKVYDTTAVIGRPLSPSAVKALPTVKAAERLDSLAAWPVSISYYEPGSDNKDALPAYELGFLFFENGVSRKLQIDYGEFAIKGELTEITFFDVGNCNAK
jgi:hypothetical protein